MSMKWRPHPWHGIESGKKPPTFVNAYIEITPFDGIKYEIDKENGYLKVDRPQATSALPPCLYGFIPQTYCGDNVAALSPKTAEGDGDPLDICVLSERPITKSDVLVPCRVIGGLRMIDKGEADDKIISVLDNDPYWEATKDLEDLPKILRSRIEHYFLTYKLSPTGDNPVTIDAFYNRKSAEQVISASMADYQKKFFEGLKK
jgi:inorganic pyrophosphatase